MKRKLLIAVPLLCLVIFFAWMFRPKRETQGEAFVNEKVAPVLSGIAQVRQQVGVLHYGERVEVLSKRNEYMKVRTSSGSVGSSNLHVFIALTEDLDTLAVMQHSHLLTHLGDAAEHGSDFFVDECFALRFPLRTKHPGEKNHKAKQRHGDEKLALHALSPKVVPMARAACTISLSGPTSFMASTLFRAARTQYACLAGRPCD